ncbi:DUF427 domain-containing protein [Pseudaminobacter sp. NGMCC 1.201702]|uniref:DUF427 domain-containing protein n=1 Tax=Pseudaminobacter sp. NGMCC 1.201702 TaxID=3391825 RepID=UPI0039EFE4F3
MNDDRELNPEIGRPDISVERFAGTVNVSFADAMVASTDDALILREEGYEPVLYVPFRDIYFEFLTRSNTATKSPHKGTASYWNVSAGGQAAQDVMWAYETPDQPVEVLAEYGAFDPHKVRFEIVPREDLQHTPHLPNT